MLYKGEEIKVDKKESARCLRIGCGLFNSEVMYKMVLMLQIGDGIDVNKAEAARYFKMEVDNDHIESIKYADMLWSGEGVKTNKEEAACYFKIASDKRNSVGMYNYGMMLYNRNGSKANKDKSDINN